MHVRFSRGWWLVLVIFRTTHVPIAKFRDEKDAVEWACMKARVKSEWVYVFGKKTGHIEARIQT